MQTPSVLSHILRKDLRHVRLLFSVWLLLLLAQSATVGSGFSAAPDDFVAQAAYAIIRIALPLLQALVVVVLVPLLIQDEPLVGTTAFWFTRPIARGQLLAAKAVFIVAFLVIPPLVLEAMVFAANGIGAKDTLLALPEVLFGSLNFIVFLASLAVLTRTFAKFVLWLAVIYTCLLAFSIGSQIWTMTSNFDGFLHSARNPTLMTSRAIASGLVSIAGGLAVVIHQYLTRRTRASLVILLVTLVASLCVQTWWSRDFLRQNPPPAPADLIPPSSVHLRLESHFRTQRQNFNPRSTLRTTVGVALDAEDVPAGIQLFTGGIDSALTFTDGTTLREGRRDTFDRLPSWWPSVLSVSLGGVPVVNATATDKRVDAPILTLTASELNVRKQMPAELQAEVFLTAFKLEEFGALPLAIGAKTAKGSMSFEVASVLKQSGGCEVILRQRRVNLWSTRSPRFADDETTPVFLLVNRRRNEAVLPDRRTAADAGIENTFGVTSRLANVPLNLVFSGTLRDKTVAVIDEQWMTEAELVILKPVVLGTLTRPLQASDFILVPGR